MSTNKTMQQLIDDVIAEAEDLMADCYREGNSFYRAVRVSPEGEAYSIIDPSRCVSEGEYYRRILPRLARTVPLAGGGTDLGVQLVPIECPKILRAMQTMHTMQDGGMQKDQ